MSAELEKILTITDGSGDVLKVSTLPFDDGVDWTDDTEAILARISGGVSGVFVDASRADLRELKEFLQAVLDADEEENL